jgi:hypothetical protein
MSILKVNTIEPFSGSTIGLKFGFQTIVGDEVTLATDATTTVSGAVTQPANTILMGVGMLCTQAFTIGSGADMGVNVGTAENGSDSSIVALDANGLYSNATAGFALNACHTSFFGGPQGEAGQTVGMHIVANAAVHTTSARNLYFKTTSSSGNPTAGKFKPLLFTIKIA